MTDLELKTLKDNLWHSADMLRAGAHLAANKYGQPILGLIFLRYADILFKQHKAEIEAEINKVKEALKGTDTEAIKKSVEDLQQKFYKVSEKLYQQANPQGAQGGAGFNPNEAQGGQQGASGDNVYEADYREVDDNENK